MITTEQLLLTFSVLANFFQLAIFIYLLVSVATYLLKHKDTDKDNEVNVFHHAINHQTPGDTNGDSTHDALS